MTFYAKSNPLITIDEHTQMVENKFYTLLKTKAYYFNDDEIQMIQIACHYHDIGKINKIFQDKMKGISSKQDIPHGHLSVLLLNWLDLKEVLNNKENFDIILNAIYYHHIRTDQRNEEIINFSQKYLQENANIYYGKNIQLKNGNLQKIYFHDHRINESMNLNMWFQYAIVKGILNKCDWTASASINEEIPIEEDYKESLNNKIYNRFECLKPLQEFMKNHTEDNIALVASTGGGKTEGALLWLNEEKSFFTLPMKVSANSIYERIKEFYVSNAAILHSDCFPFYGEDKNNSEIKSSESEEMLNYQMAKNLSYPLTVCTIDQIFKFAYKSLGTEHLIATMRYSKVIIDELQSYSPELLATIVYALKLIYKIGGKFAIITATLPKFILEDLSECQIQFNSFQHEIQNRHKIEIIENDLIDNIEYIKEIAKNKKVLIICNTVVMAQKIYEKLLEEELNIYLLHSRFIKKDRKIIEDEVINFSKSNQCGICISTQIVEASLDIDFDVLFTYMSSIDSLIQRMGRVYRNRENKSHEINIYVCTKKDGIGTIYDNEIFERSLQSLRKYNHSFFTEDEKMKCIDEIYDIDEIKDTKYWDKYNTKLKNLINIEPMEYDAKDTQDKFRNIHSVKLLPDVILQKYQKEIEGIITELKGKVNKYKILSQLDEYCINYSLNRPIYLYKSFDHTPFIEGTQIYLTRSLYEFDELNYQGKGLDLDKKQDDDEQFA